MRPARKVLSAIVATVGFIAACAGIAWGLEDHPLFHKPIKATEVSVYLPPATLTPVNTPVGATCAGHSITNPRSDATTCLFAGNLLLDPCFAVDSGHVSCPIVDVKTTTADDFVYTRAATSAFAFERNRTPNTLTPDQAVGSGAPWALIIRVGSKNVECGIEPMQSADRPTLASAEYGCPKTVTLVSTAEGFINGTDTKGWSFKMSHPGLAFALRKRDGAAWTIQYLPGGSSDAQEVPVVSAWY